VNLWALYHFRAARYEVEHYHTSQAQKHIQACLRIWPHDPASLLLAARATWRAQAFEQSEQFLDQYQAICGPNDELVLERALWRASRGDLEDVVLFCRDRVQHDDPSAPVVLEALAAGYLRMFRLEDTEFCLNVWLQRDPDNCQALVLAGLVDEFRGRTPEAIAHFRRVVQLDPEHDEARLRFTSALVDLGQGAEAIPHLQYLCRRQPDNLIAQVLLASCQDQVGNQQEAERILDGVLAREPSFPTAVVERGKVAMHAGKYEEAEKWLRQATQVSPGDYQVWYALQQCLNSNNKHEDAQALQPRLTQIQDDIRRIQEIVGVKMQRAPHDPDLMHEAGMISLRAGNPQDAMRWFMSALKENPNHGPTHKALAEYYRRSGQLGQAARHEEAARQVMPDDKGNSTPAPSKPTEPGKQ
jgi:tetratricopeptide (TPR) repeat protein